MAGATASFLANLLVECRAISDGVVADYIPELAIRTDLYRNLAQMLTAHLASANAQLRALD